MQKTLYIFNPDHDMALANSDKNFNPPLSAKKLASDLACLPIWIAHKNDVIFAPNTDFEWLLSLYRTFSALPAVIENMNDISTTLTEIIPWGWNEQINNFLTVNNICSSLLLPETSLDQIKKLSHRKLAIEALSFLQSNSGIQNNNWPISSELFSLNEISDFRSNYQNVVYKAPWSGSGKGLCWVRGGITESHRGWCKKIIQKQGSVIAEPIYDKTQDFAMLFHCHNNTTEFMGYSLFDTEKGTYRSNELVSNAHIISYLSQWIHPNHLEMIKTSLIKFISTGISPSYNGYLGVDMFVYQYDASYHIHPCVEINLRLTMGIVARLFYDRFVLSSKKGKFYIDNYPQNHQLFRDHIERSQTHPLVVENGLIRSGYLSLTEVNHNSQYRVRVEIG